jgi:uncharacterized protein (DUF488 family)
MKMVKLMFLLSREHRLYDFVPYRYGPFSFLLYHDMRHLEKEGYFTQTTEDVAWKNRAYPEPDSFIQSAVEDIVDRFGTFSDRDLIDYVYRLYPETTIFSHIKRLEDYYRNEAGVMTIGYEGRNIDRFLSLLIENKIGKLIDVRKNPFSMKYGFAKNTLSTTLGKLGIGYLHFPELGIERNQRQDLTEEGFTELFRNYANDLGEKTEILGAIKSMAQDERVALMCFEARASECHRGVIAQRFREEGLDVVDL